MVEFAQNISVNRTTCLSSFKMVTGFKPKQPIDLVLMTHNHYRVSDSASAFVSHIRAIYEEIREYNK